jgi:hypothetical protein
MNGTAGIDIRLCGLCLTFNVRSLLLASRAQGPRMTGSHGWEKEVHAALPKFQPQLPNQSYGNLARIVTSAPLSGFNTSKILTLTNLQPRYSRMDWMFSRFILVPRHGTSVCMARKPLCVEQYDP